MKLNLIKTINSLSSLSAEANELATSLTEAMNQVIIEQLQRTVGQLLHEVARLRLMVDTDDDEPEWTDDMLDGVMAEFDEQLPISELPNLIVFYNEHYFTQVPPNVRVLMCSKLLDEVNKRQALAPRLWTSLVARQGIFES